MTLVDKIKCRRSLKKTAARVGTNVEGLIREYEKVMPEYGTRLREIALEAGVKLPQPLK